MVKALKYEEGSAITSSGALATSSGAKTGRSPRDKRIVDDPSSTNDVWWGSCCCCCFYSQSSVLLSLMPSLSLIFAFF
jgi:ATP-dependent phosphoenolpyruvate carboxykinase